MREEERYKVIIGRAHDLRLTCTPEEGSIAETSVKTLKYKQRRFLNFSSKHPSITAFEVKRYEEGKLNVICIEYKWYF